MNCVRVLALLVLLLLLPSLAVATCYSSKIIVGGQLNDEGGYRKWPDQSPVTYKFSASQGFVLPPGLQTLVDLAFAEWDAAAETITIANVASSTNIVHGSYLWTGPTGQAGQTDYSPDGLGFIPSFNMYFNMRRKLPL